MTARTATSWLCGLLLLALCAPAAATDAGMEFSTDAGVAAVDASPAEAGGQLAFEASLTQTADVSAPIKAGETVQVTFEVQHPAGADVAFPEAFEPDRWVLIGAARQPGENPERATTSTWVATFGIYRPGISTLKPFTITVSNSAGQQVELQTTPVKAKVLSIFADATTEPEFAEPRVPRPVWVEDYTLAFVGGGALLAALIGLIAWWVRRRQLMQPPPPAPPRAPHEVALEKLGALAGDDLVERGEYMLYWVRLSEAVREYLGRTYGFGGVELTTTEMLHELELVRWPSGLSLEDIHAFLRRCDEVKFGGATPGVDESTATLRRAFTFVELTKPRLPVGQSESTTVLTEDTEVDEVDEVEDVDGHKPERTQEEE